VKRSTAIILIVISLAAVAGVAYYSHRSNQQADRLQNRVAALERETTASAQAIERLKADKQTLCTNVDQVREKITGLVLTPGSPKPNFDLQADPLSAPERIILMLNNWCHAPR
jgi:type II secretory pathway pseudopilin PulG